MLQSNKSTKLRLMFQVGCKAPTKTSCKFLSFILCIRIPWGFLHRYLIFCFTIFWTLKSSSDIAMHSLLQGPKHALLEWKQTEFFHLQLLKKRIILSYNVCVACIIYWWFSIVCFSKNLLLKCYRELNCKCTDEKKHSKPVAWYSSAFQVLVNDLIM